MKATWVKPLDGWSCPLSRAWFCIKANHSNEHYQEGDKGLLEILPFHKLIALCDVVVAYFDSLVMFMCFNSSMGKSGQKG